ncbi:STAS domain-containing protein [Phytohabitans houttuyneae]|uniref:Anti-sigma factor antagonist n=1 Tax=Phytohabitans houttuyneae TaxID=1076126 RepID=A0A6V8KFL0_9ACTN|nr:STAS domain-containing protein [Phytohabitans houttuyneae]GFJ84003.1 hypothetical protein Phou_081830 [Phytohabitans houttuyneae]
MSVEPAAAPHDLAVEVSTDAAGTVTLAVTGEIDVSTSTFLRGRLEEVLDAEPAAVVVDMAGVPFLDSSGLSTLIYAFSRAERQHATLVVARPQPIVDRLLHVTGLFEMLCAPAKAQ